VLCILFINVGSGRHNILFKYRSTIKLNFCLLLQSAEWFDIIFDLLEWKDCLSKFITQWIRFKNLFYFVRSFCWFIFGLLIVSCFVNQAVTVLMAMIIGFVQETVIWEWLIYEFLVLSCFSKFKSKFRK
jgi:hypothetical protein